MGSDWLESVREPEAGMRALRERPEDLFSGLQLVTDHLDREKRSWNISRIRGGGYNCE